MSAAKLACLFVILGLAVAAGTARAAGPQDLRPGIIGTDDRVRVTGPGPWQAVGQVNASGYRTLGLCTGTLVARGVVITAAHCLVDPTRRAPLPPHLIHFVAGAQGSAERAHATARCVHFHSHYQLGSPGDPPSAPPRSVPIEAMQYDVAAIVLDQELETEPAQLLTTVAPLKTDTNLVHAAYAADRRYALSAHFNCHLKNAASQPVWFTDCDTHPASSGGPIFAEVNGELRLGAVMVGIAAHQASIAVPVPVWSDLIRNAACPAP
jgi:protease YdgD